MAFFAGASNVTIYGGNFVNNEGKLTLNDSSRNTTNVNSNNKSTSNVIGSHNDNSTSISGSVGEMPSIPPRSADYRQEDYTPPPPQRPRFPPQIPSTGGTSINLDSFNGENTSVNGAFNNNSQNYRTAPPDNRWQNNGPKWNTGPNQGLASASGLNGSGQFPAPVQVPFQPQQMWHGGPPVPNMSAIGANIQQMGQHIDQDFAKWLESKMSQVQSTAAGNSGRNYDPQAANPSSSRKVWDDSMNAEMANLSLNDSRPQFPIHLSPPTSFSSDPQVGLKPTDQMGSLNPSTSNLNSHFNPSRGPRMNEPDMAHLYPLPTESRPYGNNPNRPPPPPASTSPFNFQPTFSVDPNSNFTKQDRSVNRTNIDSFNENNKTVRDSFNDNSLVDSTGGHHDVPKETRKKKKPRVKTPSDPSNSVDEEPLPEETDEQIPTAAESTLTFDTFATQSVVSSGKEKKSKKWFGRKKS